jgi:hypothetical protein
MKVSCKVEPLRASGRGSLRGPLVSFCVERIEAQKSERMKKQNGPPRGT